ncbi:MAG TPA: hypothetical protein VKR30_12515 [Candidatus Limnocylindrales bacterium]|nr:hypothetical protein [Candidatus Limnocylindrales bacterium]
MQRTSISLIAALVGVFCAGCNGGSSSAVWPGPSCAPSTLQEQPITAPPSSAASPIDVSSPNGIIVFAIGDPSSTAGQLGVAWPDGSHLAPLSAAATNGFAVSPDGQWVVFGTAGGPRLVRTDGTNEHALSVGTMNADTFAWAPNSQYIAFHGWNPTNPGVEGIYEIALGGCEPLNVSAKGGEKDLPIAISPADGSILADGGVQLSNGKLDVGTIVIDRPGDRSRTLIDPSGSISLVQPGAGAPAAFSPDGRHLAFTAATATPATFSAAANGIFLADANGGNVETIVSGGVASGIAWSTDGQWIATTRIDDSGTPQVWYVKSDGSTATFLTRFQEPGACCPVWSPDSSAVLTWGGAIIPLQGASASQIAAASGATPYDYAWVKPAP